MPDVVYDAIFGASTLRQISQSSFNENDTVLNGRFSGNTYIADQFIESMHPSVDLTTMDILNFVNIFGLSGGRIVNGNSVVIPWHARASGGTFLGGASNVTVRGFSVTSPAQIVPQSITAPRVGAVTAQGQVLFMSRDGEELPHLVNVNQTLAAQAFQAMYGLGRVYVNGARIARQVGFTVNFGVGMSSPEHYDGSTGPQDCFIETVEPSIEVSMDDFDYIATVTGGVPITSVEAYLQKRISGASYVPSGVAEHMRFEFDSGMITPQAVSAADTKHGTAAVRLAGRNLVIDTGSIMP